MYIYIIIYTIRDIFVLHFKISLHFYRLMQIKYTIKIDSYYLYIVYNMY